MSQTVTDEGLILRTQPYQENDLLVSVYFAHYGKMNLLARGVRKPKSKNASSLLPGMISEFVFILKEGLSRLMKASPVRLFRYLDSHLEVMACAQLTMEYFYRSAPDRQPNAKHYAFICQVLERLDEGYPYLLVYFFVIAYILKDCGSGLMVDHCVFCQDSRHIASISVLDGGFVCQEHLQGTMITYSRRILRSFRLINKLDLSRIDDCQIEVEDYPVLKRLMEDFLDEYCPVRLGSRKFI